MIEVSGVSYYYGKGTSEELKAVSDVSFGIEPGEFVVMLGHNGSGKSTIARMMNALVIPHEGSVTVDGIRSSDEAGLCEIRRRVGMVFQNPDSQIVCATVEEELAFGPGNLGVPRDEMIRRIDEALKVMDLERYRTASPGRLSGGQKQKVAIASVLTMKPSYIILDEPTSMLDPMGRRSVLGILARLNSEGIAVILVTQRMREAFEGGRVLVMNRGRLAYDGDCAGLFSDRRRLGELRLGMPEMQMLSGRLAKMGVDVGGLCASPSDMADRIAAMYFGGKEGRR